MKQVYRLYVDAWHSYTGYFSSLEEAVRILPSCPRFRRALSYRRPTGCEILPETFTFTLTTGEEIVDIQGIAIMDIRGAALITKRVYKEEPEVKVPGQLYKPASAVLMSTETEEREVSFGFIEVQTIDLDVKQEA